jgi:anaerobic magnesium-protoporphyrin IX monomethyl ester cyclase
MKVMLLFPPNWTPTMPHLALPTLTAYLRANGVEVIQRDLNIEVFDTILTRRYMRQTVQRLRQIYTKRGSLRPGQPARQTPPPETIRWALGQGPRLANQVEQAKNVIRSDAFFDGPIGLQAFQTLAQNLEVASLPFYPANLHLQSYESALSVDSSRALLQGVRDPRYNIFLDIYGRGAIADIEREQPDIVGISIPSMAQMLPGLTLGYLIKERGLDCHVTIGGPHISMLREEIPKVPAIFSLFDSAVVFDGEVPLLRLAEALAGRGDLSKVPNLIYNDGGAIRVTARKEQEKISDLPLPNFQGFPLDRYLAPKLVLPLLTARGCYFGKCAFCNVGYGESEVFSQLRAEHLANQMAELHRTYGTRHIFFADEAITPRNLRDLRPALAKLGNPVHWGSCVRFEKVIDKPLLRAAYEAGGRMFLFGLETASEAIVQRMVKGTQLPHMHRILRESAEVGLWNHTFFFFGFPGETLEDAQETVNFLYEHKYHINSAALGTFLLERYAPAHRFPETFGIKRIIEDPNKDLAIYFDYDVEAGMDERMAELVADRFLESLPIKRHPQFYVHDVYRFLYASYLSERGQPMPPWLVPEEVAA